MEKKILVTPRSLTKQGHPALQRLTDKGYAIVMPLPGKQPDDGDLLKLLPGCIGYLAGVEKITARVLDSAAQLLVISRNGTGIDNIDLEAARNKKIVVCKAEGANARGVAELTIAHIFALMRSIPISDCALKKGDFERRIGLEIAGRSLGVIGTGKVGNLVARMAHALGMNVVGFDPFPDHALEDLNILRYAPLDEVLASADVITLHCPMTEHGRALLDRPRIARLKKGVYLVNTARAGLLDAEAVLEALGNGRIAGVALDVFDQEPPVDRRLLSDDRVIATPHIGGYTEESVLRAVDVAIDNILQVLEGKKRTYE